MVRFYREHYGLSPDEARGRAAITTREAVAAFRQRLPGALPSAAAAAGEGPPAPPDDSAELAREIGEAFGGMVRFYREHYGLTPDEARGRAAEAPGDYLERILTVPPDQVSWLDLGSLEQQDPAKALARWEEVKQAARQEVRSGHRSARALEGYGGDCWGRAGFLAVRAELAEAVGPRSPLELLLVDQLAQWQTLLWSWQETVGTYTALANGRRKRAAQRPQEFEQPRLSEAEALERAV